MKQYEAFYGEATLHVMARTAFEAQFKASMGFNLAAKLQHLVKVRLTGEIK